MRVGLGYDAVNHRSLSGQERLQEGVLVTATTALLHGGRKFAAPFLREFKVSGYVSDVYYRVKDGVISFVDKVKQTVVTSASAANKTFNNWLEKNFGRCVAHEAYFSPFGNGAKKLSRSEMIQEIEKIIKPNGELLGVKVQSNEEIVRQINESPEKGKELFYKLVESCGARDKIMPHQKPDLAAAGGLMAKIEKGFTICWRPFSSTDSASVDIHIDEFDGLIKKFKFPGN